MQISNVPLSPPRRGGAGWPLVSIALVLALGCSRPEIPEPIRIGHAAALSGADQVVGTHAKQGIQLAVEEANEAGGLFDGRHVIVEHADTRSDPASIRPVVERLLSVNRVSAVLVGAEAADSDDLTGSAQAHSTPILIEAGAADQHREGYLYYLGLTPAEQGRTLARYAAELKLASVAVLVDTASVAVGNAFVKEFSTNKIAGRWIYSEKDKSKPAPADAEKSKAPEKDKLKSTLAELTARKPAAVLFSGSFKDLESLAAQGLPESIPVLYAGPDGSADRLRQSKTRRTIYVVTAFADSDQPKALKEFSAAYEKKFGEAPDAAAALAYDSARLLFEAIRTASSVESRKLTEALTDNTFEGSITGPLKITVNHAALRTAFVVEAKDGKLRTVHRQEADVK